MDVEATPSHSHRSTFNFDRTIYWLLLLLLVGVILLPPPLAILPIELVKRFGFALVVTLAAMGWFLGVLQSRRVSIIRGPLVLALGLVGITALVSTFFATSFKPALVGAALEMNTAWMIVLLIVLTFLTAQLFSQKERIMVWYGVLVSGAALVGLFQLVHFFLPSLVGWIPVVGPASNLIGSWGDLGLFLGFVLFSITLILEFLDLSGWSLGRWILSILGILILILTLAVANTTLWWILGIGGLILFVVPLVWGSEGSSVFRPSTLLLAAAVIVLILSFGQNQWGQMLNSLYGQLGVNSTDIRPSWNGTSQVVSATFKTQPVLGSGPNSFGNQWARYKPTDPRAGNLLDLDFEAGFNYPLTMLVMLGFVGGVFWAVFFLLLLWSGWQIWRKPPSEPVAKSLAAIVFGGLAYWWVVAWCTVPGTAGIILTFTVTGLWLGLLMSLKRLKVTTVSFGPARGRGLIVVGVIVVLLLAGLVSFYHLGLRAYAWSKYAALMSRFQAGQSADATLTQLASVRGLYSNQIFDRVAVSLTNNQIKALANADKSTPVEELRAKFSDLVNQSVGFAREALQEDSNNYNNWLTLGSVYETIVPFGVDQAGASAKQAYLEALNRNPQSSLTYVALARTAIADKKLTEAKDYLAKALTVQPFSVPAILLSVQLAAAEGKTTDAITQLEQAVTNIPNDAQLWFALGYFRYQNHDNDEAVAALTRAVQLNPTVPEIHYFLALGYAAVAQPKEALAELDLLTKADPSNQTYKLMISNIEAGRPALSSQ